MNDTPANQPETMKLTSMDIAEEKRGQFKKCLAAAFPEIMAEDKIDFDQLKRVLGEWVEPDRERFGLNWPGKAACMKVIQAPSVGTLKPCPEQSVDWDTTENLFIEGDNLEVLKLIQKAYFGKVKMIYIDPPYNTGNEFIYPDDYAETLDTYLEYTGQKDSFGRKFSTNTDTSGRFHSRWLNMMYPRLYLAKNLLSDDGAIFISIDDNEADNLKQLCDGIFGQENFVGRVVWEKVYTPKSNGRVISSDHDYILIYAKSAHFFDVGWNLLPRTEEQNSRFSNPDDDPKGPWRTYPLDVRTENSEKREKYRYEVETPSGRIVKPAPGRHWALPLERFEEERAAGRIYFGKNNDAMPTKKVYLSEARDGVLARTWWPYKEVGGNQTAKQELIELFGGDPGFLTPKPISLIRRMLQLAVTKDALVLDFFAGSCSTAQAIAEENAGDGGRRKFIMIQLPEPASEGSAAYNAGFKSVAEIGKERLRLVQKKLYSQKDGHNAQAGFRVFELSNSCFQIWDGNVDGVNDQDLLRRIQGHDEHLDPTVTPEAILFELLLKDGFPLTVPMKRLEVAGKEVFAIAEGALLICLEKELTQELMDALAEMEPALVICLDAGFKGNDQLKANAVQTFKARARTKETAIEFRTV